MFKDDWKVRYLVNMNGEDSKGKRVESEYMVCIQCQERLKAKSSMAVRHVERKHPGSKLFSLAKKQHLIKQYERCTQSKFLFCALPESQRSLLSLPLIS